MQDIFKNNPAGRSEFIALVSRERFGRYLQTTNGDVEKAVALYCWNMRLAQSLYVYLQCWEIALRNRFNHFLMWKYNANWPYDDNRFIRNLAHDDQRRLAETKSRQERNRKIKPVPTPAIVADLSAGFWVSLLSKRYDVPYAWRHNIGRIFPSDRTFDKRAAWEKSERILTLRNRVAHHEAIYGLPLHDLYRDLRELVGALCPATRQFAESSCNFKEVWELWQPPVAVEVADTK